MDASVAEYATTEDLVPRPYARSDREVVDVFERLHGELYGFIAQSVRDPAEAEDLLQEAFYRLTRQARAGRFPIETRAWLYRVASNLIVSRSRRRGTVARFLDRFGRSEEDAAVVEAPEAGAIRRERAASLEAVLAKLPPEARLGLLLSAQGFSGAEIAATIGRSELATRTMLCRARARVREMLGGEL